MNSKVEGKEVKEITLIFTLILKCLVSINDEIPKWNLIFQNAVKKHSTWTNYLVEIVYSFDLISE